MKWFKYITILAVLGVVVLGRWGWRNDYRLAAVANNGVIMVNISPERRLVSILKTDLILKETDNLRQKVFFNYGFIPDRIMVLQNRDDWRKNLDLGRYLWYRWQGLDILEKEEELKREMAKQQGFLDEVMLRDMADTKLVNSDLRVMVVNQSQENGLAAFVAARLAWAGFSVVNIANETENLEGCELAVGKMAKTLLGWQTLKSLWQCWVKEDDGVEDGGVELRLGSGWAKMIEYQSYVG